MHLSSFTDYALRVMIYLGLRPGRRSSVADIASAYDISRHHVVKVVNRLSQSGYVATFRGRGGGIELGRAPERVELGRFVGELENLAIAECFKPDGACVLTGSCVLQHALGEARDAFLRALDRYTLADLIASPAALRRRLALPR